jgi:quinol monooxygenase YgiN
MKEDDMQTHQHTGGLAVTAIWEARDGEADAVAEILARLGARARTEPGVQLFLVHRDLADPARFLFYELFDDQAAFEAHQQTDHFKTLVLEQGLPRLTKRERVQYELL